MRKTFMTIKDADGQPVRDVEQALQAVKEFVADIFPDRNTDDIRVSKVNNNGRWSATF